MPGYLTTVGDGGGEEDVEDGGGGEDLEDGGGGEDGEGVEERMGK